MINGETITRQLTWRYATKKFDSQRKISPEDWRTLEESLVLAPSSYGIQPWKFFTVTDSATQARLKPACWNQSQITDASHLVVLAAKKELSPDDINRYLTRVAEVRGIEADSLSGYKDMMLRSIQRPTEEVFQWSTRQVYIALGFFLMTAAMLGIDACPMEGFVSAQVDEILGLHTWGYRSVVLATAGYRAPDDRYAALPKVRFPADEVVHGAP
jgi:nitroreductase